MALSGEGVEGLVRMVVVVARIFHLFQHPLIAIPVGILLICVLTVVVVRRWRASKRDSN